jgi:hypothetical protein
MWWLRLSGEKGKSAMAKGQLPGDGSLRLGLVTLPWGRLIRAHEGEGEAVAWATDAPVPDPGKVWAALSMLHLQTGLVPILLDGLEGDTRQPWDKGEFSGRNLGGRKSREPYQTALNRGIEVPLSWRLIIYARRSRERASFASRGPGFEFP